MTPPRVAFYARVSTTDQRADLQLDDLRRLAKQRGWQIVGEYVDQGVSGRKDRRPELDRLMLDVHRGKVDVVAVWRFDRFARSVKHLVTALEDLRAQGIDFISVQDSIDTATAVGRMVFTVIAAMAQFEAELIRERTKAGLAAARRRGTRLGRPHARVDVERAQQLRVEGQSYRAIAAALGVSVGVVHAALKGGVQETPSPPASGEA